MQARSSCRSHSHGSQPHAGSQQPPHPPQLFRQPQLCRRSSRNQTGPRCRVGRRGVMKSRPPAQRLTEEFASLVILVCRWASYPNSHSHLGDATTCAQGQRGAMPAAPQKSIPPEAAPARCSKLNLGRAALVSSSGRLAAREKNRYNRPRSPRREHASRRFQLLRLFGSGRLTSAARPNAAGSVPIPSAGRVSARTAASSAVNRSSQHSGN